LTTTGIIALRSPRRVTPEPDRSGIERRLEAARAHTRAGRRVEAVDELRRAVQEDPLTARAHLDLAFAVARTGDLAAARASWEHFLRLAPRDAAAPLVHRALGALTELEQALEMHANG
jgi:Tfp pilus assembly protein PilF